MLLGPGAARRPGGRHPLVPGRHDEAVQQALLDRLDRADRLVAAGGRRAVTAAESDYRSALAAHRDLAEHHSGPRAAGGILAGLRTYCTTVGAAYTRQDRCAAVAPLKCLRTGRQALSTQTCLVKFGHGSSARQRRPLLMSRSLRTVRP
ncbi:hypothetical protein GQF42_05090 [Streptomyces broussonetiae]|uniref:Uncharacterized protein n=1 Tax=Streptomyces broussonetiae TaxID=2686304 RepID=A0A6I6MWW9_9ACTN|nr:hypothetical protein GQF42_05090 [Streptomyces broussonetiae]